MHDCIFGYSGGAIYQRITANVGLVQYACLTINTGLLSNSGFPIYLCPATNYCSAIDAGLAE